MKQTNRTILLKEINPDVGSLLTYIHEIQKMKSLSDAEILDIHQKLEVASFQEFMDKFTPSIYMNLDTNALEVQFSMNHFGQGEDVIRLDHPDSLFSMLNHLIDSKNQKKYVLTGFSDMLKNLIPRDHVEQMIMDRNKLVNHMIDANFKMKKKIKKEFDAFCAKYDDGLMLLMGFLQDLEWNTAHIRKDKKVDRGITGDDADLQIKVMKVADHGYRLPYFQEETSMTYQRLIVQALEEYMSMHPVKNKRVLQEILLLPVKLFEKDYYYLKERYETYSQFYITIIRRFWIASKPLVETLIGVREFFLQSRDVKQMPPTLVIANFEVSDLLQERHRSEFELYLQTVNDKNYHDNTVWYGILPNISSETVKKAPVRERFQSNQQTFFYPHCNEIPEVVLALEMLSRYQVITFMSFQVTMDNTFSGFAENGTEWMNHSLIPFEKMENKEFMVPCFPNFIVVSKEEASMNIGVELSYDEIKEELIVSHDRNVWFDEVGIEASFVAAGLVAACQSPDFLKLKHPKGIVNEDPGVAYRISDEKNRMKTYCNMISDSIELNEEQLHEIVRYSKGVFFGQTDGRMTVLTDRTFGFSPNNQLLLSMVQTSTYIERVIRSETQDFKMNLIKQFFQKKPDSIIVKWKQPEKEALNQILKRDEEIEYELQEETGVCTFSIHFKDHDYTKQKKVSMLKE